MGLTGWHSVIQVLPDTLVPASLVGLCTKSVGLAFSGWVGGVVDTMPRLAFVRKAIVCQKVGLVVPLLIRPVSKKCHPVLIQVI